MRSPDYLFTVNPTHTVDLSIVKILNALRQTDILRHALFPLVANVISLATVPADRMQEINNEFRGKDSSTDVLSFTYNEPELLGEIYLSIKDIQANAREHSAGNLVRELVVVLVHATLHVIGHEHGDVMFTLQEQYIDRVEKLL